MMAVEKPSWEKAVREASAGPELLAFLTKRLMRPYDEGPALDDRHGEGPERIFERMAREDEAFRLRLEQTIDEYFQSDASAPEHAEAEVVIPGLLDLIQLLAMSRPFSSLRAWLQRYEMALEASDAAQLGAAVLDALAIAQLPGLADMRHFWMRWWQRGPRTLRPSAFIGLRLHDPKVAAEEIPALLKLAREEKQSAGPMLEGLWIQAGGEQAILDWLAKHEGNADADEVRRSLRERLSEDEWDKLGRPRPQRTLPGVRPGMRAPWREKNT